MYLGEKIFDNQKKKTPKQDSRTDRKDPAHLAFISTLPCIVSGKTENVEYHHLLSVPGTRGGALKAPDWFTVPLNHDYHINDLHKNATAKTELAWFASYGIEWVHQLAKRLYALSGDYEAAIAVMELHKTKRWQQ